MISTAHIHSKSFLKDITEMSSISRPHVIWDENVDRGSKYAEQHNCPFQGDLDAVISDGQIDAFVICCENTRHLPLLERVLPAGKPVMCEKPLATTLADARQIAKLVEKHRARLISGYFQPFSPANRGVKKLLSEGAFGQVTHANFRNAHHAAYGRWFDSPELAWFADPELSGGGALLDMGTHAVHLLSHLFGPVEEVWATCANYSGNYEKVDDYGLIEMRFTSGVLGRVEAGWVFTGGHKGLEIIGSEKSLWSTGDGLGIGGPKEDPQPAPKGDSRPDRIARLIAVVQGKIPAEELSEDLAACLDAVCIITAAYESNRTGTWCSVEQV